MRKMKRENYKKYAYKPYEEQSERINKILIYFQYGAPGISSAFSESFNEEKYSWFKHFIQNEFAVYEFISHNKTFNKEAGKYELVGDVIDIRRNRMICKRKKSKNGNRESDCECFLRHMRNSIAHGHTYGLFTINRTYLVFEDYTNNGKLSAKIVVNAKTLRELKMKLEES